MSGHVPGASASGIRLQATQLHPSDNVATALIDLPAGCAVTLTAGGHSLAVVTLERIAAGHKFALRPLAAGEPVRKYGEFIGRASQDVMPGAWVHVHNLVPTEERESDTATSTHGMATKPSSRSTLRAAPSTVIAAATAASACAITCWSFRRPVSPRRRRGASRAWFAGPSASTSGYGRGQVAADAKLHFDTLAGLATHPNVAAVVVVSAGGGHHATRMSTRRRDRQAGGGPVAAGRARGCARAGGRRRARGGAARPRGLVAAPRNLRPRRPLRRGRVRALRCDVRPRVQSARGPHDADGGRPRRSGDRSARRSNGPAPSTCWRDAPSTPDVAQPHRRGRRASASASRVKPAAICAPRIPARRTRRAGSRRSRRRRSARSPRGAGSRSGTCCGRRSGPGAGAVPDGHAVLLARVDDRDGRRRRADRRSSRPARATATRA